VAVSVLSDGIGYLLRVCRKTVVQKEKSHLFEGYINGWEMNTVAHNGNGSPGQCISNRLVVLYHGHLNGQQFCGGFIKKVVLLSLALL